MSGILTSYYDPNDPPRASRMDEADRLLGKAIGRGLAFLLGVFAAGGDPLNALPSLLRLGGWRLALGTVVLVWALVPVAVGVEHLAIDIRESVRRWRP